MSTCYSLDIIYFLSKYFVSSWSCNTFHLQNNVCIYAIECRFIINLSNRLFLILILTENIPNYVYSGELFRIMQLVVLVVFGLTICFFYVQSTSKQQMVCEFTISMMTGQVHNCHVIQQTRSMIYHWKNFGSLTENIISRAILLWNKCDGYSTWGFK